MSPTEVLGEAWGLYKRHWRHLLPIALVVYLLLSLFSLLLTLLLGVVGAIAAGFVSLAGVFWLQGALVAAIEDLRDGRADLSIRETLSRVRPRINTIGIAGILAALGIMITPVVALLIAFATGSPAVILLVVLGIVAALLLATWWALIVPAIMLEGQNVGGAFGRSRELVRGNGWSVFALILLVIVILIGVGIALDLILSPLEDSIQAYVSDVASNTVTAPFVAAALTLAYYRLREARAPASV